MSAPLLFAVLHALERFDAKALPSPHRILLLLLADHAGDDGRAWPGKESLAARAGLSERTVDVAIEELVRAGWLERERRQGSNLYTLRPTGGAVTRASMGRKGGGARCVDAPAAPAPLAPQGAPAAPTWGAPAAGEGAPAAPEPLIEPTRVEPLIEPTPPAPQGGEDGGEGFKLEPAAATTKAPKPAKGQRQPDAQDGYRAAYVAGIADAAPGEAWRPPARNAFGWRFAETLKAHAGGRRGEELQAWIRATAAEFRRATEGKYTKAWSPEAFGVWLDAGRPARASPARVVGLQPVAKPGEFDWKIGGYKEIEV